MGIGIGIAIIVLIAAGLYSRNKQKKAWVAEERYDESGNWLDKRAGERGTYGSLDEEMEAERKQTNKARKARELSSLIQKFAFEEIPGFHERHASQIKLFLDSAKTQGKLIAEVLEKASTGKLPAPPDAAPQHEVLAENLKKQILAFAYQEYPGLLEQEIAQIQSLDVWLQAQVENMLENAG
ncbi:MAG: hypothetical protein R2792_07000 [Saprospiraceae bacterium]